MKRILSLILMLVLLLSFTACSGNFSQVDLKEPIAIPENGVVEKSVFDKIKDENSIATFTGESNGFHYEWTVFGSDITDTRDVNLSVAIKESDGGVKVSFNENKDFEFPALLSIHLNEKWKADSATAYDGKKAVYSVSVTGSKTSILNLSISTIVSEWLILPDNTTPSDTTSSQKEYKETTESTTDNNQKDDYLSNINEQTESVHTSESNKYNKETSKIDKTKNQKDDYLSNVKDNDDRVYSDGKSIIKDKYETDPVPEGKPMPVEPENQEVNKKESHTCTFSIECSTILNNLKDLDPDKRELVPSNGVILKPTKVTFYEGESVFDVLQRICKEKGIHLESSWTPIYNSAYVEGIHNLYEFDCGALSGWMYRVDGWYPNYGCSRYQLKDGEKVEWRYTCDLGKDVGCDWLAGTK